MSYKIVIASNFDKEWYNETYLNIPLIQGLDEAEELAEKLNKLFTTMYSEDYYKVVDNGYKLRTMEDCV